MNAAANWTIDATRILTRAELSAVLADLRRRAQRFPTSRMNLVLFRLASCCGLRASELCGLRLRDLHIGVARPFIHIPASIAKGGKARRVPAWWDEGTRADLEDWKRRRETEGGAPGDPFLCSRHRDAFGKPLDRRNSRIRFRTCCRILGPERVAALTIHDGRHTFCSHALAGGRSLPEVRDAAGHANISTTSLYSHVVLDPDDEPADLFAFTPAVK